MVADKTAPQSIDQDIPACQQPLEGDGPGDSPIVEEQGDRAARRQPLQVSPPRVDAPAGDILPAGKSISRRGVSSAVRLCLPPDRLTDWPTGEGGRGVPGRATES